MEKKIHSIRAGIKTLREEFPHSVLDWFMVPTSSQMLDAASESPKGMNVGSRRRQPTESEGILTSPARP